MRTAREEAALKGGGECDYGTTTLSSSRWFGKYTKPREAGITTARAVPGLSGLSENFPNLRLSSALGSLRPGGLREVEGPEVDSENLVKVQWPHLPHALPLTLLGSPDLPPRDLLLLPGESLEGAPSCNSASHRRE